MPPPSEPLESWWPPARDGQASTLSLASTLPRTPARRRAIRSEPSLSFPAWYPTAARLAAFMRHVPFCLSNCHAMNLLAEFRMAERLLHAGGGVLERPGATGRRDHANGHRRHNNGARPLSQAPTAHQAHFVADVYRPATFAAKGGRCVMTACRTAKGSCPTGLRGIACAGPAPEACHRHHRAAGCIPSHVRTV